jgi:hypothetical protein
MTSALKITIENDYDGYFESYIRGLINDKETEGSTFLSSEIVINSGPYRCSDVSWHYHADTRVLELDFYSVCRNRGGPDADAELLKLI